MLQEGETYSLVDRGASRDVEMEVLSVNDNERAHQLEPMTWVRG
jgi:hypothetical protein